MISWTFEWTCGGWNQVSAQTLEEAIEKAMIKGRPAWPGAATLIPAPASFVESGRVGGAKIVNRWAGICD